MASQKQLPNIIVCGTPGVGKTRLCQQLCSANPPLKYVNINELAQQKKFVLDDDTENECQILNDDAINDHLNEEYFHKSSPSGLVIDYHSAGILPNTNQVQAIFVLRCDQEQLSDRLKDRTCSREKRNQLLQSEAFDVCFNEAREAYEESMVRQLRNSNEDDLQRNLAAITQWIDLWPLNPLMN